MGRGNNDPSDTLSCITSTATVSRIDTLASDSTVRPGHNSASVLSAAEGLRRLRSDWRLPSDVWTDGIPQIFVGFCFQLNRSLYKPGRDIGLEVVIQTRGGIISDTALPTLENIVVLPSRCIAKAPVQRVESDFTTVDSNWVERCCGSNTLLPFSEPEYVDLGRAEEIDKDLDLERSNLRPREKLQFKGADRDRFDYIVSLSERYDFDRGSLKDFYNLIKDSAVRDRPKYARGTEGFIRKYKSLFYRAIPAMSARTKSDRMTTARRASSRARLESENTPPSSSSVTSSLKHMRSTSYMTPTRPDSTAPSVNILTPISPSVHDDRGYSKRLKTDTGDVISPVDTSFVLRESSEAAKEVTIIKDIPQGEESTSGEQFTNEEERVSLAEEICQHAPDLEPHHPELTVADVDTITTPAVNIDSDIGSETLIRHRDTINSPHPAISAPPPPPPPPAVAVDAVAPVAAPHFDLAWLYTFLKMSPVEKIPHEVPSDATLREDMMRQLPEHRLDPVIGSPGLKPHHAIFANHMVKLFASNSVLIPCGFFSRYEDLVMTGLDEMDAEVSSLRMEFKNREMKFILIPFQHKHRLVAITVDCVRNIATHFGLSAPDDLTHAKELVDIMYEQLSHGKTLTWYCHGPLELKDLPPLTANDQASLVSHVLQRVTLSNGDITIEDLHSEFVHSVDRVKESKA